MTAHLSEALINELAESNKEVEHSAEVAEHLATCSLCQEELDLARLVTAGLAAIPRIAAPPELLAGVMSSIDQRATAGRRRGFVLGLMAALIALVLVVLWLVAGGAATLVIDALETIRSLEMVTRIASSVWRTIPLELFGICTVVLVGSSAVLSRIVARFQRRTDATAEAG